MDEFIGIIKIFAGNFAPKGWAFCDGKLLPINQNQALFSIIGTTYGGDGRINFALPDLRSRVPVGMGQGQGLYNWQLGQQAGVEATANVPAHTHGFSSTTAIATPKCLNDNGSIASPKGNTWAQISNGYAAIDDAEDVMAPISVDLSKVQIQSTGDKVDVIQPSLGVNYIICLEGVFPVRD